MTSLEEHSLDYFKQMIAVLERDNALLKVSNETLKSDNETLRSDCEILRSDNDSLNKQIQTLASKIAELEKKLGRNSSNSSLPPSRDNPNFKPKEISQNRAQRRAKGRKPGKQPGDAGKNLAQVTNPDEIVIHAPNCCEGCGGDLSTGEVTNVETRQVFDIPDPKLIVTEHQIQTKLCECGTTTKAEVASEAPSYTSYGPRIQAFAVYLLCYQHLPFERCAKALFDLFGAQVSTGWLDSVYSKGAQQLEPFIAQVLSLLMDQDVVHVDETFDFIGVKRSYFHVICNDLFTLLHADVTRGKAGTERAGLFPDYSGIVVHDRLAQYFSYDKATHAICCAHLIRNLASVAEIAGQDVWATKMTALLLEMKLAGEKARDKGEISIKTHILAGLLARYDTISSLALLANQVPIGTKRNNLEKESYNLAFAMYKYREEITRFATDLRVPFTNNAAEKDLRMVKLHAKISGPFRSMNGQERLAKVRSYIQTAIKHKVRPIEALTTLFMSGAWIPTRT